MPTHRSAKPPRWARILEHLLLHGLGIFRILACTELFRQVKKPHSSSMWAAGILARALDANLHPDLKHKIAACIGSINTQNSINTAWQVWLDTRNTILLTSLQQQNRVASKPAAARVYSLLASPQAVDGILMGSSVDEVQILAEAACGPEPDLASRAVEILRRMSKPAAIDTLCAAWAGERSPILESLLVEKNWIARRPVAVRLLTCLLNNQLDKILMADGEMISPLIAACVDANPILAARAQTCLPVLQSQAAIDAFCQAWDTLRSPLLEKSLLLSHYRPTGPFSLRLKVGLKIGQTGLLRNLPPQAVGEWLVCLADSDPTIRSVALETAAELPLDCCAEICRLAIHSGNPAAMLVVNRHDFRPDSIPDQALLLFLQERWAEYTQVDFDYTLLQTVYTAASEDLRKRIADRVRSAGRPEFLPILSGGDPRYRSATYSPQEADTLVSILTSNRDYAGLWKLVPFLPIRLSIAVLHDLTSAGWQPDHPSEKQDRADWTALALALPTDLTQIAAAIPWALPCASLRVRGRINAISFAPNTPHLAVATGEHHLVEWDYAQAAVHTVYSAFSHSLAHTVYGGTNLFCSERSTSTALCGIYRCYNGEIQKVGQHFGPTTSLIPFDHYRLISTGRDARISLWDFSTSAVGEQTAISPAWPRSALVTSDPSLLFTFAETIQAWQIPDLVPLQTAPYKRLRASGYRNSPIYAAAVSPDKTILLVGQSNGRVLAYSTEECTQALPHALLTTHPGAIRQITFLSPGCVMTAGTEGQIRVFSWPEMKQQTQIDLPEGRLSTLSYSPDGAFMAAGGSDAQLTLWDLRMDRLHAILRQPLAACTPTDLNLAISIGKNSALNADLSCLLDLVVKLLRFRFRFDVQIAETKSIRPGEFDIIL